MSNITDAQRELLAKGAAEPGGVIAAPDDAKLAKALIKRGLVISLPVEGGASRLIITEAGRVAVGSEQEAPGAADGPAVEERAAIDVALDAPQAAVAAAPPAAGKPKKDAPRGKLGTLVELLKRPEGATVAAMSNATGWQAHSVRGAMSGSLKKGFGFEIGSEKTDAGRIYMIPTGEQA
jgi:Protein of unknown function (DUF3489)